MGFLDHLLDPLAGVGGVGKRLHRNAIKGERLLRDGARAQAQIVGIRVIRGDADSPDEHEYALVFAGDAGAQVRSGCRQPLGELRPTVRLGMEVPVRHDGGRVIIDTPAMGATADEGWGWKGLGDPPLDGIEDYRFEREKEHRKGTAAIVTILGAQRTMILGIAMENVDLGVRVALVDGTPPYETTIKRELIPFYALHLAEPGTDVPGVVRNGKPDKVKIDWGAAAVAVPGVGAPPAPGVAKEPEAETVAGTEEPQDWSAAGLAADELGEVEGVSFPTWVEVEAGLVRDRVKPVEHDTYAQRLGVPAGTWGAAQRGWQQRMMRDPRVGARFGSEYQAAVKRR